MTSTLRMRRDLPTTLVRCRVFSNKAHVKTILLMLDHSYPRDALHPLLVSTSTRTRPTPRGRAQPVSHSRSPPSVSGGFPLPPHHHHCTLDRTHGQCIPINCAQTTSTNSSPPPPPRPTTDRVRPSNIIEYVCELGPCILKQEEEEEEEEELTDVFIAD